MLIQTIAYKKEAPGTSFVEAEAVAGDSLTMLPAPEGSEISILDWSPQGESVGEHRLIWPSGHDTTYGLMMRAWDARQPMAVAMPRVARLLPREQMTVQVTGGTSSGKYSSGALTVYYADAGKLQGRYIDLDELQRRGVKALAHYCTPSWSSGSDWLSGETLDETRDVLRTDREYAWLGYSGVMAEHCVALRGPDTGNVRVGAMNYDLAPVFSRWYFVRLAELTKLPVIPVISGANKGATWIDCFAGGWATPTEVTLHLVELAS